ncbi:hypothetical protein GW17_00046696 [Ensete ventricosum]|nr:hypothetical protein GW17_00046696 [Ensete ventricosum]
MRRVVCLYAVPAATITCTVAGANRTAASAASATWLNNPTRVAISTIRESPTPASLPSQFHSPRKRRPHHPETAPLRGLTGAHRSVGLTTRVELPWAQRRVYLTRPFPFGAPTKLLTPFRGEASANTLPR